MLQVIKQSSLLEINGDLLSRLGRKELVSIIRDHFHSQRPKEAQLGLENEVIAEEKLYDV